MLRSGKIARVIGLVVLAGFLVMSIAGCRGLAARRSGPIDAFAFLPSSNPELSQPVQGAINNRPDPKEISLVVPPGTDMSNLVASVTLKQEATITVISTGQRVVQRNGETPNNFNSPVTYAIEIPDQEEPVLYTVRVREASTNARLIDLSVANSSYQTPTFGPTVMEYEAEVPYATRTIQVSARAEDPNASAISIGGRKAGTGSGSGDVDFSTGDSVEVVVEVVAEDQSTRQEYRITVVRGEPDRNSNLGSLVVEGLAMQAGPDPAKQAFSVEVPYSAKEITVGAVAESQLASVAVNGTGAGEGGAVNVPLTTDMKQTVNVVVTAEDGSTTAYTISVARAAPDDNPALAAITVSGGELSPEFVPTAQEYSLTLPVDQDSVTISARAESALTTVAISTETPTQRLSAEANGAEVAFTLDEGAQAVVVITTAAESGDSNEYRVSVRRDIGMNSLRINGFELVGATLTPAFDPGVTEYAASVPAAVDYVTVTASPLDASASLYVNGQPGPGWPATVDILLYEGLATTTQLALRAPNGLERVYTFTFDRGTTPSRVGRRVLEVSMDELRLSRMVASSLNSNRSDPDAQAMVTVRYRDTGEVIYEDTAPVTTEKARQDILISMSYRSQFIDMDMSKYLEIEVAIPTTAGRYLHYNTVAFADGSLDIRPDFLVLSERPGMDWPEPGTPRPVNPRVRYEVSDEAQRRVTTLGDAYAVDGAGEFIITLELINLTTGESLGSQALPAKPGSVHGRGIEFASGIELPEGAPVGYVLTARTRDGRLLRDHGAVAVRTTKTFENGEWEYADLYIESVLELIEPVGN